MKKSSSFGRMAMVLLSTAFVFPLSLQAQECAFTPDQFPGQSADRTELEVNATAQVGVSARGSNVSNLTSSNPDVVALYRGMVVNFIATGTADVIYTETDYSVRPSCSTDHIIHYTVEKGSPTAYFAGADGKAVTEYNLPLSNGGGADTGGGVSTGGDGGSGISYSTPSLVMKIKMYNSGRGAFIEEVVATGITYASTNPAVAEINAETGVVTVKGVVGETTISATWPGNENWNSATASYKMIVKKQPVMYFSPYSATDTVGNVLHLEPIITTAGVTVDAWQSSKPDVAEVDDKGNVTMKHFGTSEIDAIFNGNDEYFSGRCRFYLTVSKKKPHIAFEQTNIKLDSHDAPVLPAIIKPTDMTENYTWRSNNPSVLSINTNTGELQINNEKGFAQIQCFFGGDENYLLDTARCNVELTTSGIYVMGEYARESKPDVLGDGSVMYVNTIEGPALVLYSDVYDAKGNVFISASSLLRILVKCNCEIKNTPKAIESTSAVFIWCQNRKDSITINATYSAIAASAVKIHDCYLFATGGTYGINSNNEITVSAGGYVFAQGGTEAIRARQFIKGENAMGGIEILTKGVTFAPAYGKESGGFFSDPINNVKATFVELGKVPLPISKNIQTSISFEEEEDNPYDNLNVVFSESKEDKFNSEDKQIELVTKLKDEQVTKALEDHTPCSSDWKKKLPGSIVFDVPEGDGQVDILCKTEDGYELQVKEEGKAPVTLEQGTLGEASVKYSTSEQSHLILYLREKDGGASAPARVAAAQKGEAAVGAIIKAITIVPKGTATEIDAITNNPSPVANKFIRDGLLLIERDGVMYNAQGAIVK